MKFSIYLNRYVFVMLSLYVYTTFHSDIYSDIRSTRTRLYNFDPLKPHFYIVKLGFTGVNIFFLFLLKNIDCGYPLEPPRRGGSNEYHNLCFDQKYEKYLNCFI